MRYIFDLALEGTKLSQIACILNEEDIPTPNAYNVERMESRAPDEMNLYWPAIHAKAPREEQLWNAYMVRTILRRYEYTGALIMSKHKVIKSAETGKTTTYKRPESELIVTENAHEAIVTAEEFEKVQEAVPSMKKRSPNVPREYPLKGKIRCGNCRRALSYVDLRPGDISPEGGAVRKRKHDGTFWCAHKYEAGELSACNRERYGESDINEKVLNAIERVISVAQILEIKLESRDVAEERGIADPNRIETQIRVMKEERIRQYEGYADGMITRKEYLAKKQKIDGKIEKLEAELEETKELLAEEQRILEEIKEIGRADDAEDDSAENQGGKPRTHVLTRALVEAFIDTVYIYDMEHIEIVFTCEDVMKAAMDRVSESEKSDGAEPAGADPTGTEQPLV